MGRDERAAVEAVLERLPATVLDWSDGLATMTPLDVIEVRRPIRSLSSSGGGRWWVAPRECREELEAVRRARPLRLALRAVAGRPRRAAVRLGLHARPGEATFGAGFSSISTDHWPTLATDPDPPRGTSTSGSTRSSRSTASLGVDEADAPGPARRRRVHLDAARRRAAVRALVRGLPRRTGHGTGARADLVALVSRLDDRATATRRHGSGTPAEPDRAHARNAGRLRGR